jgi:hypothetical protein
MAPNKIDKMVFPDRSDSFSMHLDIAPFENFSQPKSSMQGCDASAHLDRNCLAFFGIGMMFRICDIHGTGKNWTSDNGWTPERVQGS